MDYYRNAIKLGGSGVIGITKIEGQLVTFVAQGVEIRATTDDAVRVIGEQLNCDCRSISGDPQKPALKAFKFVRDAGDRVRDPNSYLLATQRAFTYVIDHFKDSSPIDVCG